MEIAIVAFEEFTDLDLILHWDILNRVKYIGGIQDWSVRMVGTAPSHKSFLGLDIPMAGSVDQVSHADGVIICSGTGTRRLLKDQSYLERLNLDSERQFIGAQCSGSLILGAKGMLKNLPVSAYPPILSELSGYGARLIQESLVIHGRIATASSCLAGQKLSQWLIESLVGAEVAAKVMETVLPIF